MPARFVESLRDIPTEVHRVETAKGVHWRTVAARADEIQRWIDDPVNEAKGIYTYGVKQIPGQDKRALVFYFDNVDTAFRFKLRWA